MKKKLFRSLWLFCIFFIVVLFSNCATFNTKTLRLIEKTDCRGWLKKWQKKVPLDEENQLLFKSQSQVILIKLLEIKKNGIISLSLSDANFFASNFNYTYSGIIRIDPNFAANAYSIPELKNLEKELESAKCFPSIVSSRIELKSRQYLNAIKISCECSSSIPEVAENINYIIDSSLKQLAEGINEAGSKADYNKQAELLVTMIEIDKDEKIDLNSLKCPSGTSGTNFKNYALFLSNMRSDCLQKLQNQSKSHKNAKKYLDAKKCLGNAIRIAQPTEKKTLDQELTRLVNEGRKYYTDQSINSEEMKKYDDAKTSLKMAGELDPTFNVEYACKQLEIRQHMKAGDYYLEKGQEDEAIQEYEKAKDLSENKTPAEVAIIAAKDQKGLKIIDEARILYEKNDCRSAVKLIRTALPLLRNPEEAKRLEKKAIECATIYLSIWPIQLIQGNSNINLYDIFTTGECQIIQSKIINKIIESQREFTKIVEPGMNDRYKFITSISDCMYNSNRGSEKKSSLCRVSSTQVPTSYIGGSQQYREVYTYKTVSISKYLDHARSRFILSAKIIDENGLIICQRSELLTEEWKNETWILRENIDPDYVCFCPSGDKYTLTDEEPKWVPSWRFLPRESIPSAKELILPSLTKKIEDWTRAFVNELDTKLN